MTAVAQVDGLIWECWQAACSLQQTAIMLLVANWWKPAAKNDSAVNLCVCVIAHVTATMLTPYKLIICWPAFPALHTITGAMTTRRCIKGTGLLAQIKHTQAGSNAQHMCVVTWLPHSRCMP